MRKTLLLFSLKSVRYPDVDYSYWGRWRGGKDPKEVNKLCSIGFATSYKLFTHVHFSCKHCVQQWPATKISFSQSHEFLKAFWWTARLNKLRLTSTAVLSSSTSCFVLFFAVGTGRWHLTFLIPPEKVRLAGLFLKNPSTSTAPDLFQLLRKISDAGTDSEVWDQARLVNPSPLPPRSMWQAWGHLPAHRHLDL